MRELELWGLGFGLVEGEAGVELDVENGDEHDVETEFGPQFCVA